MKSKITSAIFILVFSVASVNTMQAQSAKNHDSSLSASDNTPSRRITASVIKNDNRPVRLFDSTQQQENTATVKRTQRSASEAQSVNISTRQKPVRIESNFDQTSGSQKADTTKYSAGMVDAQ